MNREIKLRYWDGKEICEDLDFLTPAFGSFSELVDKYKANDWVIIQYTGLKDVNGEEIWEGDIVEITNMTIAEVVYEPELATFMVGKNSTCQLYENIEITTVVGNIYENPELLEGGKYEA